MKIGELKYPGSLDYTEAQRSNVGGQGLRDKEAKGGNAARKIQQVLS